MQNSSTITLYHNSSGAVFQCNQKNCFILEFQGVCTLFKVPCFLAFRKKVNSVDLEKMLSDACRSSDIEILSPCSCERVFVLSVNEVIELKDLVNGAKAMLELNSIIRDRLQHLSFLDRKDAELSVQ